MKIVLITRDRPRLTVQTIHSMKKNAADWSKHELLVVFDGTQEERHAFEEAMQPFNPGLFGLIHTGTQLGVGGAKNRGVQWLAQTWPTVNGEPTGLAPDDIIMFSDNDMYYLPDWDKPLSGLLFNGVTQLGGWRHPYHQFVDRGWHGWIDGIGKAAEVDAVTGNCFVIRYQDWLKFGPFDANALGPGQSEDYALSQKIKAGGGHVAALTHRIAIHCGLRNSIGQPAVGWLEMSVVAQKQIKDYGIADIYLEVPDEGVVRVQPKRVASTFAGLNVGSGQRRFETSSGWINVDHVSRPPDQVPDVVCNGTELVSRFGEGTQDVVVLHHVLEHFGCGEADEVLRQSWNVLRSGGSLLLFVPDMQKLAGRYLSGEIDDFTFMVNVYGAYQGEEGDRHKWGYNWRSLVNYLIRTLNIDPDQHIRPFDWRTIPGADIARDWWILGVEVVK